MNTVVEVFHQSSKLEREQIWAPSKPYIPSIRTEFSLLSWPGYVGRDWNSGGTILIGANGNSTENKTGAEEEYSERDRCHMDLINRFRKGPNRDTLMSLMEFEKRDIQTWSLWATLLKTIERLDEDLDRVCILNVIPFSTVSSPPLNTHCWSNSVRLHLIPLISVLQPSRIVWIGKSAQKGAYSGGFRNFDGEQFVVSRQRNLTWDQRLQNLP